MSDAGAGACIVVLAVDFNAGLRFVILYFSECLTLTSSEALVASSGYNIEMSLTYKSIRIPSLQRLRLGSARDCVNSTESMKVIIPFSQSCGACWRP